MSKFGETAAYVVSIIKVEYYTLGILGIALTHDREITLETTLPFLPMAVGSTLKSVDVLVWTSSCSFGQCR